MLSSIDEKSKEVINYGEDDEMEIEGYKRSKLKTLFTWMGIVGTLGLLRIVFHWWPHLLLWSTHILCKLDSAKSVLICV
jgi:cation-transporting ATPase 13A2